MQQRNVCFVSQNDRYITIDLNVMYYIYFKLLANQFFAVHPHLYIKIFA